MISAASLLKRIQDFVEDFITQWPDVFWVEARTTPGNKITVLLDADKGLNIEKCTQVSRALYKHIEEKGYFPEGNFSLEVSSPGIDRPMSLHRQYRKNLGRKVEVMLKNDNKFTGVLKEVKKESLTLEPAPVKTGNKKEKTEKTENKPITISMDEIKYAKVLITF